MCWLISVRKATLPPRLVLRGRIRKSSRLRWKKKTIPHVLYTSRFWPQSTKFLHFLHFSVHLKRGLSDFRGVGPNRFVTPLQSQPNFCCRPLMSSGESGERCRFRTQPEKQRARFDRGDKWAVNLCRIDTGRYVRWWCPTLRVHCGRMNRTVVSGAPNSREMDQIRSLLSAVEFFSISAESEFEF